MGLAGLASGLSFQNFSLINTICCLCSDFVLGKLFSLLFSGKFSSVILICITSNCYIYKDLGERNSLLIFSLWLMTKTI
jgi:hypothetical protein